jgi:hypothetical protein
MGIEPTSEAWEPSDMRSFGATSVQLKGGKNRAFSRKRRQGNGLEFLPSWFVARRSIQLSYGRTVRCLLSTDYRSFPFDFNLERLCILGI